MDDRRGEIAVPPALVLGFLAEMLDDLARRMARVEAIAADLAGGRGPQSSGVIALQELDVIRQTLEDAARLAGIAGGHQPRGRQALTASVRLEAVRCRLAAWTAAGGPPERSIAADRAGADAAGPVDLFVRGTASADGGAGNPASPAANGGLRDGASRSGSG